MNEIQTQSIAKHEPPRTVADAAKEFAALSAKCTEVQPGRVAPLGLAYFRHPSGAAEIIFRDPSSESTRYVAVPTAITKNEFDQVVASVIPLHETQVVLSSLARAYSQRRPIILEGGTGIGKTFLVNTFVRLLYGPMAKPLDFYCDGQSDTAELMGRYVPRGLSIAQQDDLARFIKSPRGYLLRDELLREGHGSFDAIELQRRAMMELGLPITNDGFVFQLGLLPKAMTATVMRDGSIVHGANGPGAIVHVQEAGMAPPPVLNALLKLRGEKGQLADELQLWEHDGQKIEAGPDFFMVMSTNPPSKLYPSRAAIDPALSRAVIWVSLPPALSPEAVMHAGVEIFSMKETPPSRMTFVDLRNESAISKMLAEITVLYHLQHGEHTKNGETGRSQKIPVTMDHLNGVARLVQTSQSLVGAPPTVDLVETLKMAIDVTYINALESQTTRKACRDTLDKILNDASTGTATLNGIKTTRAELVRSLTQRALSKPAVEIGTVSAPQRQEPVVIAPVHDLAPIQTGPNGPGPRSPRTTKELLPIGGPYHEFLTSVADTLVELASRVGILRRFIAVLAERWNRSDAVV